MNKHQERLLTLLKEIDAICKKYDITYYCTGGTLIGAVRHGGFIPWDDDIDVYMMRDDFFRFCEAFKKESPKDRALTYREGDSDYHSTIPRYVDLTTTVFSKYHMLGHAPAGTLIDVFILDPVPHGREAQKEYLDKFNVYCDFVMPFYSFSHRTDADKIDNFDKYLEFAEKEGEEALISGLSCELFSYDLSTCDEVMLRWGSIPNIFPKEMFGEPVYFKFEDAEFPMPALWYDYLVKLYGSNWMYLPHVESQETHDNITRMDMKYDYFYDRRDELISSEELKRAYFKRKADYRNYEKEYLKVSENRLKIKEALITSMDELVKLQTSVECMGQMNHTYFYRWMNPYILNISDSDLQGLLENLYESGDFNTAEKLTNIYVRGGKSPEPIIKSKESIDNLNEASKLYYGGKYKECIDFCSSIKESMCHDLIQSFKYLSLAQLDPERVIADCREYKNDNYKKALGDAYYNSGNEEKAGRIYRELMKSCRNGLFWNDIASKMEIEPISLKSTDIYAPDKLDDFEKQLLDEVIDICEANNIKYVLAPRLARRLYVCGNLGYSDEKKIIYMDAVNALKFIDACKKINLPDRKILTWEDNQDILNLSIVYTDRNSLFLDFKNPGSCIGLGANVSIMIIRRRISNVLLRIADRYKEYITIKKGIIPKGKLFNKILNKEVNKTKGEYYYKEYRREGKPKILRFYTEDWKKIDYIIIDSRRYAVPSSAKGRYFRNEVVKSNKRKPEKDYVFYSLNTSWEEHPHIIESIKSESSKLEKLERSLNKSMFICDKAWQKVLAVNDSMLLKDEYEGKIDEMQQLQAKGAVEELGDILSKMDILVKHYNKYDVSLTLHKDIKKIYYDYLRKTEQIGLLKKLGG